jgi:hypothetical protein
MGTSRLIGQSLAHFRITAKLGEGGMGEVYRAADTKLEREVAIKMLPEAVASDSERLARFEREAKVLASLNHPHIAAIYAIESAVLAGRPGAPGASQEEVEATLREPPDDQPPRPVHFLVMELAEGEDLAARIGRGPVPVDEAIQIARQIAEALEVAHERGIIHRDLKPANIKVDADGEVKVLDFGLAKALDPAQVTGTDQDRNQSLLSRSPTLTAQMTQEGVILGTAAYMSPEQARGHEADQRSDIWSFGVLLHEMLTGERLFEGPTVSDTLAAVLTKSVDGESLPVGLPGPVRRVLRRTLERDPKHRLHAIADARIDIEEVLAGASHEDAAAEMGLEGVGGARVGWMAVTAALALAVGAILGALFWPRTEPVRLRVRASIPPPAGTSFELHPYLDGSAVVSPDGTRLVFAARPERGPARLWVRRIDASEAQVLEGTEGAIHPFWSPDSLHIAFFADGELRKIAAAGGPTVPIVETTRGLSLHYGGGGEGGTWNQNDDIVYALGRGSPLYRVKASGGVAEPLEETRAPESGRFFAGALHPRFLPDGDRYLFVFGGTGGRRNLMLGSLSGEEPRELMEVVSYADYAAGYLWYVRKGTLFARRFDTNDGEVIGEAVPVAQGAISSVWSESMGQGHFSVSPAGVIAFHTGSAISPSVLTWYDREGRAIGESGTPSYQYQLSLAPDDATAILQVGDMKTFDWGLWSYDLVRGVRSRINSRTDAATGVWSPNAEEIVFQHRGLIYRQTLGIDEATLVREEGAALGGENVKFAWPLDWSEDGEILVFATIYDEGIDADLWGLVLAGSDPPFEIQHSPAWEEDAAISPDGRWLAYTSNRSGQFEIYLTEFPRSQRSWQVSAEGGIRPEWGETSTELFFLAPDDTLMLARLEPGDSEPDVLDVERLFGLDTGHHVLFEPGGYAVSSKGDRILVSRVLERGTHAPITLIVGWPPEIEPLD